MNETRPVASGDHNRIRLQDEYGVREWTAELGCTEVELRKTVALVGDSEAAVRDYLRKTK